MLFLFVLMLAVGVSFGISAPSTNNSTAKTTAKAVTKSKPATGKSAMQSTARSSAMKTNHVLASAEDISGTITLVDPTDKEITLVGSDGVPYDFELTKKTQVELANQKIGMNELSSESHKQATIHLFQSQMAIWPKVSRSMLLNPPPRLARRPVKGCRCTSGARTTFSESEQITPDSLAGFSPPAQSAAGVSVQDP